MPGFFFHIAFDLYNPSSAQLQLNSASQHQELVTFNDSPKAPSEDLKTLPGTASEPLLSHDWRYGVISNQTVAMAQVAAGGKDGGKVDSDRHITNGISAGPGGLATKGIYEPLESEQEDLGWGVIRLYRDTEETPGLYDEPSAHMKHSKHNKGSSKRDTEGTAAFQDEDCTTLCILAVPSYLTPSDFLRFVGEKTRNEVSHFRMIRTERSNRYMVLMKFRNGKKARQWRREWNGKAFDVMDPENCHVVFVKSISFRIPLNQTGQASSFPDMANDPFTPSTTLTPSPSHSIPAIQPTTTTTKPPSTTSTSRTLTKPAPPPTPSLIELPTCPVCLERMDESTGLLTILCQHVFHCSCLQKWKGSGCPVCRYTHASLPLLHKGALNQTREYEETGLNECAVCHSDTNLWICLICGCVGCGRYDAAHAFAHYEASGHCFAMELDSQRVWDYASDVYVHRIIQDKTDGKLVDMTHGSACDHGSDGHHHNDHEGRDDDFDDYVPREKLTNVGLEYTALLTSQLDSQRLYYEEILERAADKASQASTAAEKATFTSQETAMRLAALQLSHDMLLTETIPQLEKDKDRAAKKAEKFEQMARKLEREWRDEKAMNFSLMERTKQASVEAERLKVEKAELEEQNRDLGFFISGGQKLQSLGGGLGEEISEGTVSLPPEEAQKGKKKGKGKR